MAGAEWLQVPAKRLSMHTFYHMGYINTIPIFRGPSDLSDFPKTFRHVFCPTRTFQTRLRQSAFWARLRFRIGHITFRRGLYPARLSYSSIAHRHATKKEKRCNNNVSPK